MTTGKIDPERLLTSSEVGELLQVNPSSVKKWVNDGRILAFRTPGGHRRIRAADLVAFLDVHKMPIPRPLSGAAKKRLLVVDDDAAHLRVLARQFKRWADRVQVELVGNGIDALVRVGSFKPHLIVIDVVMPEVDGFEVCRRLKSNPETEALTVLLTTAHLTPAITVDANRAGAVRVLRKPVGIDVLLTELGITANQEV